VEGLVAFGMFLGDAVARIVLGGSTRLPRGSLEYVARRHPRSRVFRAELVTWPGLAQEEAATVRFVIADPKGLSFRDAYGGEVLRVAPRAASDLELVESGGSTAVRAGGAGEDRVDFWLDGVEQDEGLAALHAAVLRTL